MKTLRIVRSREIEVVQVDEPRIQGPHDVKIQVAFAGMCPDDMPFFRQDTDMLVWGPILFPGTGHEMAGTVVEVGEAARHNGYQEGMRVSGYAWNQCGHCYYCLTGRKATAWISALATAPCLSTSSGTPAS